MRDIQKVMELWGGWAASDSSGVDYSPIAAGFKGLLPQTGKSRLSCTDDDALIIEGCLARLKKENLTSIHCWLRITSMASQSVSLLKLERRMRSLYGLRYRWLKVL